MTLTPFSTPGRDFATQYAGQTVRLMRDSDGVAAGVEGVVVGFTKEYGTVVLGLRERCLNTSGVRSVGWVRGYLTTIYTGDSLLSNYPFYIHINHEALEPIAGPRPVTPTARNPFPHVCLRCGQAAFRMFATTECTNTACVNHVAGARGAE